MPSHEFDKQQFDNTANNQAIWRMRACDLHLACTILREKYMSLSAGGFDPANDLQGAFEVLTHSGLIFQSAMLQGFAFEAYLKAYWLHTGHKLAEDGEYGIVTLPRDNHDLPAIADAVSFTISDTEREVLSRLSLFVSSYGRYPITKKWHQNPMRENEHGIPTRLSWNDSDHELTEQLIERISSATTIQL